MTAHEKLAYFNLLVVGAAVALFLLLMPLLGARAAMGAFGLLGLLGLAPMFVWPRGRSAAVVADERDQAIQARAVVFGYSIFWLVFVAGTMGTWTLYHEHGTVPADLLPLFPLVGWLVLTTAQAAATLYQYRRGR